MRRRLNCWLVAMYLWAMSRARGYAWVRRSKSFRGLIPHFGYAEEAAGHLIVIEYVPPEGKLWTFENRVIVFRGSYKVSVLKQVAGASFPDLMTATRWGTEMASALAPQSSPSAQRRSCHSCGASCEP